MMRGVPTKCWLNDGAIVCDAVPKLSQHWEDAWRPDRFLMSIQVVVCACKEYRKSFYVPWFVISSETNDWGLRPPLCTNRLHRDRNFMTMVRWLRWYCPPDTGFEIRALAVWGRVRYLSVTKAPHNTSTRGGEETFLFLSNRRVREPNPELWRERQRC